MRGRSREVWTSFARATIPRKSSARPERPRYPRELSAASSAPLKADRMSVTTVADSSELQQHSTPTCVSAARSRVADPR